LSLCNICVVLFSLYSIVNSIKPRTFFCSLLYGMRNSCDCYFSGNSVIITWVKIKGCYLEEQSPGLIIRHWQN
jgi:hypothetical protein